MYGSNRDSANSIELINQSGYAEKMVSIAKTQGDRAPNLFFVYEDELSDLRTDSFILTLKATKC